MQPSLLILALVLVLIAARRVGRVRIRIWQSMVLGAAAALALGQISPGAALAAIDVEVMLFLFGMFVVGEVLVASGYLYALAHRLLHRLRSLDGLVLTVILASGAASALLMNDTLAIVATPLMLRLAEEHRVAPRVLLLALAFGITTGSVLSPIGNPQNLLIAVRGPVDSPFLSFLATLALPTAINLLLAYGVLRWIHRREFHSLPLSHQAAPEVDPALTRLARLALVVLLAGIGARILLAVWAPTAAPPLSWIALAAATPILLFSARRGPILRDIDWGTLAFFAAMFVLMASVWQSGALQRLIAGSATDLTATPAVLGVSAVLSQLISNVPMVALYLPVLQTLGAGTDTLLALAAGSTLAGNLLIIGAASNVIIVQRAESRGATLGFLEFARAGVPLTLLQLLVCALLL